MKPIYLDYNATTPLDPEVIQAMEPFLREYFGNPSSNHWFGVQTKKAVENARKQVANLLNCHPDEVVFTSGGTESNNYAIKGIAFARQHQGRHIITSQIEHPAVIEVCRFLEDFNFKITYLPVDKFGRVEVEEVEKAITPQTILITIMHANNEVGTIQPISEIAALAKNRGIIIHTDAAQSAGKIPTKVDQLGVDLLSLAGHKLYAPKGIGALFIRRGTKLTKLIHGADHEQNRRAGTENILEIVGLGKACEIVSGDLEKHIQHLRKMRDHLYRGLENKIGIVKLNGHPELRLPNTLSVSFPNIEANLILSEMEGVAASAGAACHSDSVDISPVLTAMKIPVEQAMGTIRFSTGRNTTQDEIDSAVDIISNAVQRLMRSETINTDNETGGSDVKLTHFTAGLGCACKLRPQLLEKVLADLPPLNDANVLVGTETEDDAAVYRIDDSTAIVQTVDFFTPIVDDPYHFGAIAAANSLSDIYAMGGRPLFGLNIVGFPSNRLPVKILKSILKGAQDKAEQAGISIVGGHTVEDNEPKFGMAVTGIVHPRKILTNSNAQPGDVIVLTKPVGLGIITTAIKRGLTEPDTVDKAIEIMETLNRNAAEVITDFPVNACTDITGFGLLGHLREMSRASQVNAEIYREKVPWLEEAWELASANVVPGGTLNNLNFVQDTVEWSDQVSEIAKIILCDAQTSGGLLISLPATHLDDLIARMHKQGIVDACCIGKFTEEGKGKIFVK